MTPQRKEFHGTGSRGEREKDGARREGAGEDQPEKGVLKRRAPLKDRRQRRRIADCAKVQGEQEKKAPCMTGIHDSRSSPQRGHGGKREGGTSSLTTSKGGGGGKYHEYW